jgi:hypothetical protein
VTVASAFRANESSLRNTFLGGVCGWTRRCDASAWSGAVLRPLSLLDIYSISGESVLGRRQNGAALRIPAPDFITQTAELGERC